jgi:hypothetical protein
LFSFEGEGEGYQVFCHGDDHGGNIFVDLEREEALVFDPAASGYAPVSLAATKALFQTYTAIGGEYFDPKLSNISYSFEENCSGSELQKFAKIKVEIDFQNHPMFSFHKRYFESVFKNRILPIYEEICKRDFPDFPDSKQNSNSETSKQIFLKQELRRIQFGAAICALLVVNPANLLENYKNSIVKNRPLNSGTGQGLFPLARMVSEFGEIFDLSLN